MANDTILRAVEVFRERARVMVNGQSEGLRMALERGICESPIEQILFAALCANQSFEGDIERVKTQEKAGKYRIDISVYFIIGDRQYRVAVECDGHDYHEKTEQQARRDKAKDRYLQSKGWLVARFTGKQIVNDPHECVREIITMVYGLDIGTLGI